MEKKSRRKFITDIGIAIGALSFGRNFVRALPRFSLLQKKGIVAPVKRPPPPVPDVIDFRYSPSSWQSTYCFPDDPYKSLVGKNGELLYGHPGAGGDYDVFPQIVGFGIKDAGEAKFVDQKLEAPGIPIVITKLAFTDLLVTLTSFATDHRNEGRVDNLLILIHPREKPEAGCTPEIVVNSRNELWLKPDDDKGEIHFDNESGKLFLAVKSPLRVDGAAPLRKYQLKSGSTTQAKPLEYVVRFPQAGQSWNKIDGNLDPGDAHDLLEEVRKFWLARKPGSPNVSWNLPDEYGNFYTASIRNMVQSREVKEGKNVFQVGPTVYRGFWYIDGTFLIEAARYAGFDKEAQDGLEWMWNTQKDDGSFTGGAGQAHWKDTAAPIFALIRQAELTQNWDYFRELYPDAVKAMYYLRDLRNKAVDDGTANGKYKLLPRGFGDSGIGGIRSELANTLWALIAMKHLNDTSMRLFMARRQDVGEFFDDLRQNFRAAAAEEMRQHPNGFSYLPLLMKDDPQWSEPDPRKQPRPQAAQIYLSQAIYPGYLFASDHAVVTGHVELMKAVTKEEIPIETGWMTDNAVWTYNGAVLAQTYLWLGMQELARKTFIGFLNHASPLYAWREEQPLHGSEINKYIGDMPHNWASAECIRYLRHMLIFEDGGRLRLLDGLGIEDLVPRKPMILTYSPTRWGRVSLSFEPLETKAWSVTFKREGFDERLAPKLTSVEMPRHLPGEFQFDKMIGSNKFIKNGPRVYIDVGITQWQVIFRNFSKR